MKKQPFNIFFLVAIVLISCQSNPTENTNTVTLKEKFESIKGKGILFGHQDDLAYGKRWKYVEGESDVKRVTGDYPAVFGWELGGLERGDQENLDSVPFDLIVKMAIKADSMGGINTFSWHPYSLVTGKNSWYTEVPVVKHIIPNGDLHEKFKAQLDKVAELFLQLKDANNQPIEFIFRPWHEMNGEWFWWGKKLTTPDEYKALFRFTVDYLVNKKGLKNMMICYSPNGGYKNAEEFLTWYPGDDIVEMIGADIYLWPGMQNWVANTQRELSIMIQVANEKQKLAAFTETGCENLPDPHWYTQKLGAAIAPDSIAKNLSYVLVWRNDPVVHHFFTYVGHPSEQDTKQFLEAPNIWLLNDFTKNK